MEPTTIEIKNAREHNLKAVSLSLPRGKLIVFTGVSGSGKSSLAFDTLYAEGQRRYIESLSSYARQFMGQMAKPDCDLISGLSPSIAIQQKTTGWNPRSTVGTITAIHDFLRVLYARIGVQHCTKCGRPITAQSREQIVAGILREFANPPSRDRSLQSRRSHAAVHRTSSTHEPGDDSPGSDSPGSDSPGSDSPGSDSPGSDSPGSDSPVRLLILAPVARGQKGEFRDLFDELIRAGYVRARVDGEVVALREDLALQKNRRHDIEVVIDRLTLEEASRPRLAEAVESALRVGKGTLIVAENASRDEASESRPIGRGRVTGKTRNKRREVVFSSKYACANCSISYEPPSPQLFSFNSPTGMCPRCDGLGELLDFDPELLAPDASLNFLAPCIAPMRTKVGKWRRHIYEGVARAVGFDLRTPWNKLTQAARDALLHGTGDRHITYEWRWSGGVWKHGGKFEGVIAELREKHRKAKAAFVRSYYEKFMRRGPCLACSGGRLNPQALAVRLEMEGRREKGPNIREFCAMSIAAAHESLSRLKLTPVQQVIAEEVLKEVRTRLEFLIRVGLHYLTLERTAPTLSGGELQRIRLAGQIGAGLVGVLYVLDEPSIGLHHRDNDMLLDSLKALRDMGNTVIVVEHDEATIRAADHVVDFGPGPGVRGGHVVAQGNMKEIMKSAASLTGQYLSGRREIEVPRQRRPVSMKTRRQRATAVASTEGTHSPGGACSEQKTQGNSRKVRPHQGQTPRSS